MGSRGDKYCIVHTTNLNGKVLIGRGIVTELPAHVASPHPNGSALQPWFNDFAAFDIGFD